MHMNLAHATQGLPAGLLQDGFQEQATSPLICQEVCCVDASIKVALNASLCNLCHPGIHQLRCFHQGGIVLAVQAQEKR